MNRDCVYLLVEESVDIYERDQLSCSLVKNGQKYRSAIRFNPKEPMEVAQAMQRLGAELERVIRRVEE